MPFLNQRKGENDRRKYFVITLHERMLSTSVGVEPANPHKTSGPDMIPARLLLEYSKELAPILVAIFNKSLQIGTVPADWKQANVLVVFKKGQHYDPANYWLASLTCLCCKLLEHVIVSNMVKHVDQHEILTDCQHGFRRRRSCETQLVTLVHHLASAMDRGIQTDMVILDFSKALTACPTNAFSINYIILELEDTSTNG